MKLNYRLIFTLIILLLTHINTNAEVYHWPQLCNTGELSIKNKADSNTSVWLQKFGKTLHQETEIELGSQSNINISLDPLSKDERYSVLIINDRHSVDIKYKCNNLFYSANSLEGGTLTFKKSDFSSNKIWMQNLYTDDNEVTIEFQTKERKKITGEIVKLSSLQSVVYDIPESAKKWSYFTIVAEHRSSVFSLSRTGHDSAISAVPQKSNVDTSAFYFLIGPRNGNSDTFIAKITDTKLAEKARELIKFPQTEKMMFAKIQKNDFGFNRNWSKPEKSFWSWSTSEVTNFGDLGSTACNGVPQEVEDRMDYWVTDPGQICFWNYRVKKELSAEEIANGL